MITRELVGAEAEALVQEQIRRHSAGIQDSLAAFDARSAIAAWLEALRGVEELINLPLFEIANEQAVLALVSLRLDCLSPPQVANLQQILADQFEPGVARRFVQTLLRSAAIGLAFRMHGMACGEEFRTLGGAITYFQSRRRQMVALLYCMPLACSGTTDVEPLDALNVFLPIVEHSCVGLTSLYRHLVLLRIHGDYALTVGSQSFKGNYSFDMLDESFLEPERVGITEVPCDRVDAAVLKNRMMVAPGRVFSVPELCNDLLAMEPIAGHETTDLVCRHSLLHLVRTQNTAVGGGMYCHQRATPSIRNPLICAVRNSNRPRATGRTAAGRGLGDSAWQLASIFSSQLRYFPVSSATSTVTLCDGNSARLIDR